MRSRLWTVMRLEERIPGGIVLLGVCLFVVEIPPLFRNVLERRPPRRIQRVPLLDVRLVREVDDAIP